MNRYIDTHIHLDLLAEPALLLQEAEKAGVGAWIVPGVAPEQWSEVLATTALHEQVFVAPGIHPQAAGNFQKAHLDKLRQLLSYERAVAIGEVGLDRRLDIPWPQQEELFIAMIRLAREMEKRAEELGTLNPPAAWNWQGSGQGGVIINISSIGCLVNAPRFAAYVASKSALDAFVDGHREAGRRFYDFVGTYTSSVAALRQELTGTVERLAGPVTYAYNSNNVTILFAKQRHCAEFLCLCLAHTFSGDFKVIQQ